MKLKIDELETNRKIGGLEMERKILIKEISNFCIQYGIFKGRVENSEIEIGIEIGLENIEFIESLINTIINRVGHNENIDIEKVKFILLELERIRLDLEYSEIYSSGVKID